MPQLAISLAVTAGLTAVQYLLTPKVKQQPVDKGKMDDVRVQGSDYGTIIPRTWGKTRMAGNAIFSSGVDHYTVSTGGSRGGKKGRGATPPTTEHIYKTSVAVLISRGKPVSRFLRIWADADLITANNNTGANDYGSFEAENATLSGGATNSGTGHVNLNSGTCSFNVSSLTDPPLPINRDPDESYSAKTKVYAFYKANADCTATTSSNIASFSSDFPLSSDWTIKAVLFDGFIDTFSISGSSPATLQLDKIEVQYYWQRDGFPEGTYNLTGVVNPSIAYPTDLNDPSGYYDKNPETVKNGTTGTYAMETAVPSEKIRFYTGTETQTPDSKIKSWLDSRYGAGEGDLRASAYRGMVYVVFEDRTLRSNRVDNFTFETDTGDATVNTILTDLFTDVGLAASDYDLTATAGLTQAGFLDHQNASRKSLCEALERYHFFRLAEIDGKIRTVLDTGISVGTIDRDILRAHSSGEEMPTADVQIEIKEDYLLPKEVRVSVMQPDLEYHNESVAAQLFTDISGNETVEYTFPIVDTASNARLAAEKLILKAHAEDKAYEFWGMPEMAKYAVGDVITVPISSKEGTTELKMRIEKKQMTLPIGKIRFQCMNISQFTPDSFAAETTELAPKSIEQFAHNTFPRNSVAFVIQSEAIREQDRGKLGVYLAVSGRGRGHGDPASLYREMDEDNFVLESRQITPVPLGLCAGTLGNHAGGVATEDTTNTLDIWFFDDVELETVTQADIDRHPHTNLIRVGNEWIQFRTAAVQTLEANSPYKSKWRISNLWRGRYNTAAAISTHTSKEYAAIADVGLMFYELDPSDVGETVSIKAVTGGQNIEVAPVSTFTFAPVGVPTAIASESLSAANLVNVYNDAGTVKVRKANATNNTKPCTGYVLRAASTSDSVYILTEQGSVITGLSGLTPGTTYYLSTTSGALTATAPSATGNIVQRIGTALSATSLIFEPGPVIEKA